MSTLKVKCSVCNSFNAFNSVLSCKHEICLKCSKRGCPKCLRENPQNQSSKQYKSDNMSKMLTDLNNENKRLKDEINNLKLSNLKSSRYKNQGQQIKKLKIQLQKFSKTSFFLRQSNKFLRRRQKSFIHNKRKLFLKNKNITNKLIFLKNQINIFFNIFELIYENINQYYPSQFDLQKISILKNLLNKFDSIKDGNKQFSIFLAENQRKIKQILMNFQTKFIQEFKNLQFTFDLMKQEYSIKIKILFHKLHLFSSILNQSQVRKFVNKAIFHIKKIYQNIAAKTDKDKNKEEYLMIQEFNSYLNFQQKFKQQLKLISNNLSEEMVCIDFNLRKSFIDFKNICKQLELQNQNSPIDLNLENIEKLAKLIINIRFIIKNERYWFELQMNNKQKIKDLKEKINIRVKRIKDQIIQKVQDLQQIQKINIYVESYYLINILAKLKDFDGIWQNQENLFHNYKFCEIYQKAKQRYQIQKKDKISFILFLVGNEKINVEALKQQVAIITENKQILNAFNNKIKQIISKRAFKLEKIGILQKIDLDFLMNFKEYWSEMKQLKQMIKNKPQLSQCLYQYFDKLENMKEQVFIYLKQRFTFLKQNYKTSQFDKMQKQLTYLSFFQQFHAKQFDYMNEKLRSFCRKEIQFDDSVGVFKNLSIQFEKIQIEIQQLLSEDNISEQYCQKVKDYQEAFTTKQSSIIMEKIQKEVNNKIQETKIQWQKGNFKTKQEQEQIKNLIKNFTQFRRYQEKMINTKAVIKKELDNNIQFIINNNPGLQQITQNFLPKILQLEQHGMNDQLLKYYELLRNALLKILKETFPKIQNTFQFLSSYIYDCHQCIEKSSQMKKTYKKVQMDVFKRLQNANQIFNGIEKQLRQSKQIISQKCLQFLGQLDEIICLYFKILQKLNLSLNKKQFQNIHITRFQNFKTVLQRLFTQMASQLNLKDMIMGNLQQKQLMIILIKLKIIANVLQKFKTNKLSTKMQEIVNLYNKQMQAHLNHITKYSFEGALNKKTLNDKQMLEQFANIDRMVVILQNNEQYWIKFTPILENSQVNLTLKTIKSQNLIKSLQASWKDYYQIQKLQIENLFKVENQVGQNFQLFIRARSVIKNNKLSSFHFVSGEQYDVESQLKKRSQIIKEKTKNDIKQLSRQYDREKQIHKQKLIENQKKKKQQQERVRQQFDQKIAQYQEILDRVNKVAAQLNGENNKLSNQKLLYSSGYSHMRRQVQQLQKKIQNIVEKIKKNQEKKQNTMKQIEKLQKTKDASINDILQKFKQSEDQIFLLWQNKIQTQFKNILENLKRLQNILLNYPQQSMKKLMNGYKDEIFNQIDNSNQNLKNNIMQEIYKKKQDNHLIANIVNSDPLMFQDFNIEQFNKKIGQQDEHYVVNKCESINKRTPLQKKAIIQQYLRYKQELQNIQQQYKNKRSEGTLSSIIDRTIKEAEIAKPSIVLGRIFGIQSILRAKNKDILKFLRNPHPAQIIAIFLLIQKKRMNQYSNGLAQIKTGQGKSIVLAGLCSYLALQDYHTYCACYSSYLSERDEKEFHELFKALKILDKIKYGTFADHCKQLFNCNAIIFKDVIKQFLIQNNSSSVNRYSVYLNKLQNIFQKTDHTKRILIIDEVDVFFQQRYFGQIYRPAISLQDTNIKKFIKKIWSTYSQKHHKLKNEIMQSMQYNNLIRTWPHLKKLLQNQLESMIAAKLDPSHSYEIHNQKIVYRYNDVIEHDLNCGYKTVFSACKQYDESKVSRLFYEQALKMSLIISQFSYAELPRYFNNIMGVSGTLQTLQQSRKRIMKQKYEIQDCHILPSIYGPSRRIIESPHIISNNYENSLIDRICQIQQKGKGRPILVFFRTRGDMATFDGLSYVKQKLKDCYFLSEDQQPIVRQNNINLAGKKGRVTFMTSYFSRGTDFKLDNKELIQAGGYYVIQTYISKNQSDYVQVYGRTARQGKQGSFEMIIKRQELTSFNISIVGNNQLESAMKKKWRQIDTLNGLKLNSKVQQALKIHNRSFNIIKSLSRNIQSLIDEVQQLNFVKVAQAKNVKTIIALDGTGSMSSVIQKAKEVLSKAIQQAQDIISSKSVHASFEIQIMIYRNYSSGRLILEYSGFQNDAKTLTSWLGNISASGGQGNEALQIIYHKVNKEIDLNQLIIIGDAACNTLSDIQRKRDSISSSQSYWQNMGIPYVRSPEEQLNQVIRKGIPIHSLYILTGNDGVQEYFTQIGRRSGGQCQLFDVNHSLASKKLGDFIAKNVLNQIGGKQLVNAYVMRFG